mgnify:CR=1 FL=1
MTLDRRDFLKATAAAAATPLFGANTKTKAGPDSETLVTTLYQSLTAEQRAGVCLPFHHELRSKVDNAWFITPQQAMIREIFEGLYNPSFVDKVRYQIKEDGAGLGNYSVALFGEPGKGKFEFVLTGRHCTVRCDGDSVDGAAFGGPIFYGHQAGPNDEEKPDHPNNVFWFQAKRVNDVFGALNGKQREMALVERMHRPEQATGTVQRRSQPDGMPLTELARDQRELVEKVLVDLLLPFRQRDADETLRLIKADNGVSKLNLAFYKNADLGSDGVWDVWQLESPKVLWYFRRKRHVHVWLDVKA